MLSIEIGRESGPSFKSIDHIVWADIPKFVVLTGLNGSGKTQLLQALAYKFANAPHHQFTELNALHFAASGETIGPDEVAYMPNSQVPFRVDVSNISQLAQAKGNLLSRLQPQSTVHDLDAHILRQRIEKRFGFQIHSNSATPQNLEKLPDDFLYMLEYGEVAAGLSHVFVGYQLRLAQMLLNKQSEEKISEDIGKPPWIFVNDALAAAGFGYRIIPPSNNLLQNYQARVVAIGSETPMSFDDLSSGEKTILRTLLWFYNSKHNSIFPKLFLLDEPDAHLHPTMTRQFMDILKNVL